MRILQVISGIEPENGGPTSALTGHCRALVAAGAEVSIVATWKHESSFALAEELKRDGIPVTLLGPTKPPFRKHPAMDETLAAAVAAHDVVHIHAVWEAIEHRAAVLARELAKPYVWTPHGMLDEWNMRRNHWFKRACMAAYLRRDLKAAAAIHVATDFEKKQVARLKLGTPFFVQGFGLDESLLTAAKPPTGSRLRDRLAEETPLILFLGRIQHGKGLETLVPALKRMKTVAHLAIVGPDEHAFRRQIYALIARHDVADRITFVGMLNGREKLQAIADADILAAPSAHENFGIAVAEALALGTAVVVSDQVGLADFIQRHDLGRVAPAEIAATAAALDATLVRDPTRFARSRALAREHFAWPAIAAAWTAEYARILGRNSR